MKHVLTLMVAFQDGEIHVATKLRVVPPPSSGQNCHWTWCSWL